MQAMRQENDAQTARTKLLEEQVSALTRQSQLQANRMAAMEQQVAVLAKAVGRAEKDRMVASTR
jgi:hypothetical protein